MTKHGIKSSQKAEMTPEKLAKKYFPALEGLPDNNIYSKIQHTVGEEFLSDLRSVIRGETSELLKQRDELLVMLNKILKIEDHAFTLKGFDVKRLKSEIRSAITKAEKR